MAKKNWIAKATSNSHGQFRAKAQRAGKSTRAYAEQEKGASGKTGKQARLALALMGASKSSKPRKKKTPEERFDQGNWSMK